MKILILHKWLITGGIERVLIDYLHIFTQLGHQVDLSLKYDFNNQCALLEQIPQHIKIDYFANAQQTTAKEWKKQHRKDNLANRIAYEWQRIIEQKNYRDYLASRVVNYNLVIDFSDCLDDIMRMPKFLQPHFPPTLRWVHLALSKEPILSNKQKRRFTAIFSQHTGVVAICDVMRQQIQENIDLPEYKLFCLHNPIALDNIQKQAALPVSNTHQVLLQQPFLFQAARLESVKNLFELIDIYAALKSNHSIQHKLYIAGDGSLKNELQHKIDSLNLSQDCLLLGNLDNPYPFFQAATLFLHTSTREGLPTVLLESMACGTPVVAMDCPTGVADILGKQSEYGKLIPMHNQQMFQEAVISLLNDAEQLAQYQQKATQRAADFSAEQISQNVQSILEMLKP